MKRANLIIKLLLFSFFLYNVGFFSFITNLELSNKTYLKEDRGKSDIEYLSEKIEKAKNLGDNYGPEEYFSDLTDIELRKIEVGFDHRTTMTVNSSTSQLHTLFHSNLMDKRKMACQSEYDLYINRISKAQDYFYKITDLGHFERKQNFQTKIKTLSYWTSIFLSFLKSLRELYLKNIWLAFLLLWLWWYEDKKKIRINNPVSFLFCLAIYPIVISRVLIKAISQKSRYFAMSIELRRREKNLFSLFSENEISQIKALVQSNISLRDYRHQLNKQGLAYQHALLPTIVVTCLMVLLPLYSSSQSLLSLDHLENCTKEVSISVNSPPGLYQNNFSVDDSQHDSISLGIILEKAAVYLIEIYLGLVTLVTPRKLSGHIKCPKPIPLFVDEFLPNLSNYFINKKKEYKNEKFNNNIDFIILDNYTFSSTSKTGERYNGRYH